MRAAGLWSRTRKRSPQVLDRQEVVVIVRTYMVGASGLEPETSCV
jgi:hypothetical protein